MQNKNFTKKDAKHFLIKMNRHLDDKIDLNQSDNLLLLFEQCSELIKLIINSEKHDEEGELAENLLNTAKQDLKASRTLYENKLYPQSMFYLQQSVEKTTKAYGLELSFLDPSDLAGRGGVGHITPRAFVKLIETEWAKPCLTPFLGLIQSMYSDSEMNVSVGIDEFGKVIKDMDRTQMGKMSKEEIERILSVGEVLEKTLGDEKTHTKISRMLNSISMDLASLFDQSEGQTGIKNWANLQDRLNLVIVLLRLYFLSIITYPHFNYTRYPDMYIKPHDYENLGITKAAPEIFKKMDECFKLLESV